MKILIVEDDSVLADGLTASMKKAGYMVDCSKNGEEAGLILSRQGNAYDLVILDLGLPGMDGTQVLKRMRSSGGRAPVLILTARDTLEQRVRGLDLGADDYITKPFELPELEARVRALLRRGQSESASLICLGPLSYDTVRKMATVGTRPLELSSREICILEVLLRNAGRVVGKGQILENLCGWDEELSENAIEVYIHRLRKKLDDTVISITTIRGLGYLIKDSKS